VTDWPKRPEFKGTVEAAFSILPEDLRRAYEAVYRAVSKDDSRPALASLHVAVNGDISFHGCDSYRLHMMEASGQALMDGDMLIPRKAADAVVKHTKGRTAPVLFERAGSWIKVAFGKGDDEWVLRACESQYPKVEQLVPDVADLAVGATVERMNLLACTKQAEATLKAKTDPVVLAIDHGKVEFPKAGIEIEADTIGPVEGTHFGVNGEFLRLALMSFTSERVTVRFQAPIRPFLILGQTTADPRCLLMPVKLQGAISREEPKATPAPTKESEEQKAERHRKREIKKADEEARDKREQATSPTRAKDDPKPHFFNLADRYLAGLEGDRRKYGAAYVSFMIGDRKTAPKRADVPPRQAFNTRSKLRALAQQAGYEPVRGVPEHEDAVR
jgi:hypothetical protein